jgi:hypothetical protein
MIFSIHSNLKFIFPLKKIAYIEKNQYILDFVSSKNYDNKPNDTNVTQKVSFCVSLSPILNHVRYKSFLSLMEEVK